MKTMLFRTSSGPIPVQLPITSSSPKFSVSISFHENNATSSPIISLHMDISRRNIRRSSSESDLIRSEIRSLTKPGSRSFQSPAIPEEERSPAAIGVAVEVGFPGGGMNNNRSSGGNGGGNWSGADENGIGDYYREILKSDSNNALILRNYAKYLHEMGDLVKAEEYYSRAILASPGDGEVLSLYGKLIWESDKDESRAKSYFDQAVIASPDDCTVLGSYAHFLWEAEEEEEDEVEAYDQVVASSVATMIEAF